jgi:phospholipase/carboxylesterase
MTGLHAAWRRASGEAAGALVLIHGRGSDEHDLLGLADHLDPEQALHVVCPRGPLSLPPGGAHWYALGGIGTPDVATFTATFAVVQAWLEALPEETGVPLERTIVGGFSQGCVMAHALGLISGGPTLAGTIHLSGFMPSVPGFTFDPARAAGRPTFISHGTYDPVIGVEWGRAARDTLTAAGADVAYDERAVAHSLAPETVALLADWVARQRGQAPLA